MTFSKMMLVGGALFIGACSSNPYKAEKVETQMEKRSSFSETSIGVKDGNLVVQRKREIAEELRDLQYEVYGLEDRVYGNTKFNSLGLYGVLKDCKKKLSDKRNGGDGKLIWTEPVDRVTDKEEDLKFGIDEEDKIVSINEEFLKDRINRFHGYRKLLNKRNDEYREKLDICETELSSRAHDMKKAEKSEKAERPIENLPEKIDSEDVT
jgi:hypothetical protein